MQFPAFGKGLVMPNSNGPNRPHQFYRIMRLSTILLLLGCLQASAAGFSQTITYSGKGVSLDKVFTVIEEQTGFLVAANAQLVRSAKPVTIEALNEPLEKFLKRLFAGQTFGYSIRNKTIFITSRDKEEILVPPVQEKKARPISGIVHDGDGKPLEGATITIKGTNSSALTNAKGVFAIEAGQGDVIVISYVGFDPQIIKVTAKMIEEGTVGLLKISPKMSAMEESIVVAYGKTTQRANTGAISVVKGEQIRDLPNMSFDKSLQGLVPGLVITKGSGQPGGAPSNFLLRGIATGGDPSANGNPIVRNPLIIIDGVPISTAPSMYNPNLIDDYVSIGNPLAHLNPAEIETISVLKDASAIALYGSRASNGVILVTTKKGKAGKVRFSFSHRMDIANRENNEVTMLNQQQYIDLFVETFLNSNPDSTREQVIAKLKREFPTRSDGSFYPESNWINAISDNSALTNSTNFAISGGSDRTSFYINLEHSNQNGVIKKSGFSRSSLRINFEGRPSSWFKYGLNTGLYYTKQDFPDNSILRDAQFMSPLNPIYDEAGNMIYNLKYGYYWDDGTPSASPYAFNRLNIRRNHAYHGVGKANLEASFLKYFTFSSAVGFDFMLNENQNKTYPKLMMDEGFGPSESGRLEQLNMRTSSILVTNSLLFNWHFLRHHSLSVLTAQEAQMNNSNGAMLRMNDLTSNPTREDVAGEAYQQSGKENRLSYFSQLKYGFKDRYFLQGSFRIDGASNFGTANRYGTFWSVSGGYLISEEPVIRKYLPWLNFLKLRGSFGPAGNSAAILDRYRLNQLIQSTFLGKPGVYVIYGGNSGIRWEQTFSWDAGVELQLLNKRLSINADVYNRKTKDFIANLSMPPSGGFDGFDANIGDMKNTGVEISLNARVLQIRDFSWSISANWARNSNKLTKSYYPQTGVRGTINKVGEEFNSYYTPIWAGVDPLTGRPQWLDENKKPTTDYSKSKSEIIGKAQPDGTGAVTNSFNYKGFSLSAMLYFSYGSTISGAANFQNDGLQPYWNQSIAALDHWRKPGDQSVNPRRLFHSGFGGIREDLGTYPSTRFFFDGDYIRLSNVNLGYTFPASMVQRWKIDGLRLFAQATNLALWTRYSGSDPENINAFGGAGILYPQARTYSMGIDLSF